MSELDFEINFELKETVCLHEGIKDERKRLINRLNTDASNERVIATSRNGFQTL